MPNTLSSLTVTPLGQEKSVTVALFSPICFSKAFEGPVMKELRRSAFEARLYLCPRDAGSRMCLAHLYEHGPSETGGDDETETPTLLPA